MYNEIANKQTQPSRIKKIAMAVIFMVLGCAITVVACSYYWSGQLDSRYRDGVMAGEDAGYKKAVKQHEENIQARLGGTSISKGS